LTLPNNINRDSIDATFTDGVLRVTIEKSENAVTKQIQIK
jgi:HSP20 family molecular chaperone IbpA